MNKSMYKNDDIEGFFSWIDVQGFSSNYTYQLKGYFRKFCYNKEFNNPLELQKYCFDKEVGKKHIIKAFRVYLNYCEQQEIMPIELIERYRKVLKLKQGNKDVWVPSDQDVNETYQKIKDNDKLRLLFLVLATSGIRYIEAIDFLRSYEKERFKHHNGFVSFPINQLRKTKNINNIYLPLFVYKELFHFDNSWKALRIRYNERKPKFSLKYLRKWHYNMMIYAGVPESVADFIQGRSNRSVGANHYLAKSKQAEYWYEQIYLVLSKMFLNL